MTGRQWLGDALQKMLLRMQTTEADLLRAVTQIGIDKVIVVCVTRDSNSTCHPSC